MFNLKRKGQHLRYTKCRLILFCFILFGYIAKMSPTSPYFFYNIMCLLQIYRFIHIYTPKTNGYSDNLQLFCFAFEKKKRKHNDLPNICIFINYSAHSPQTYLLTVFDLVFESFCLYLLLVWIDRCQPEVKLKWIIKK